MGFVTWIVAGVLMGGAASALAGSGDYKPFALNVAVGSGSMLFGGWLLGVVIGASAYEPGVYGLSSFLVSLLGAAALLAGLHEFRRIAARLHIGSIQMKQTLAVGRTSRPLIMAGLAGLLVLFAACATAPAAPESALDAARVAISNAEKADAGRHASAELGEARDKYALAGSAVRDEDMVVAERLALESRVQAELASARTAAAKAAAVNQEMSRGADALAEEMQRAGEPR